MNTDRGRSRTRAEDPMTAARERSASATKRKKKPPRVVQSRYMLSAAPKKTSGTPLPHAGSDQQRPTFRKFVGTSNINKPSVGSASRQRPSVPNANDASIRRRINQLGKASAAPTPLSKGPSNMYTTPIAATKTTRVVKNHIERPSAKGNSGTATDTAVAEPSSSAYRTSRSFITPGRFDKRSSVTSSAQRSRSSSKTRVPAVAQKTSAKKETFVSRRQAPSSSLQKKKTSVKSSVSSSGLKPKRGPLLTTADNTPETGVSTAPENDAKHKAKATDPLSRMEAMPGPLAALVAQADLAQALYLKVFAQHQVNSERKAAREQIAALYATTARTMRDVTVLKCETVQQALDESQQAAMDRQEELLAVSMDLVKKAQECVEIITRALDSATHRMVTHGIKVDNLLEVEGAVREALDGVQHLYTPAMQALNNSLVPASKHMNDLVAGVERATREINRLHRLTDAANYWSTYDESLRLFGDAEKAVGSTRATSSSAA
eukprot:Clim_evm18s143 gene=Clim_evmTU18s143